MKIELTFFQDSFVEGFSALLIFKYKEYNFFNKFRKIQFYFSDYDLTTAVITWCWCQYFYHWQMLLVFWISLQVN